MHRSLENISFDNHQPNPPTYWSARFYSRVDHPKTELKRKKKKKKLLLLSSVEVSCRVSNHSLLSICASVSYTFLLLSPVRFYLCLASSSACVSFFPFLLMSVNYLSFCLFSISISIFVFVICQTRVHLLCQRRPPPRKQACVRACESWSCFSHRDLFFLSFFSFQNKIFFFFCRTLLITPKVERQKTLNGKRFAKKIDCLVFAIVQTGFSFLKEVIFCVEVLQRIEVPQINKLNWLFELKNDFSFLESLPGVSSSWCWQGKTTFKMFSFKFYFLSK